jgi:hypothetical protein
MYRFLVLGAVGFGGVAKLFFEAFSEIVDILETYLINNFIDLELSGSQ